MSDAQHSSAGEPVLLDIAGAARHLGITEVFIRRLVHERRLRYYKLGKFVRFRVGDLDAWVEHGRVEPTVRRPR
jgi:excisionase family DNA binding protein